MIEITIYYFFSSSSIAFQSSTQVKKTKTNCTLLHHSKKKTIAIIDRGAIKWGKDGGERMGKVITILWQASRTTIKQKKAGTKQDRQEKGHLCRTKTVTVIKGDNNK